MAGTVKRRIAPAAVAVTVVLLLTACLAKPGPRAPHTGELIGTWRSGSTSLVLTADRRFEARGVPASDIEGATVTGTVSFRGDWILSGDRYAGFPRIELLAHADQGLGVGGVTAVFDSTTNPVSIAITYGGPEVPQFLHLSRR